MPLTVTPAPVFMGRAEVMTRGARPRIEAQLATLQDPNSGWREPVINTLGRFATPAMKCIEESPVDPVAEKAAQTMLGR
jgi:hypothetical protein